MSHNLSLKDLLEVCEHCGLNKGAHHGGNYYSKMYKMQVPYNYCPGHQNRMDWNKGPGTVFKGTNKFRNIPYCTPACACEFYNVTEPVCACGSETAGKFVCTKEYSLECQWANERRKKENETI